jgi:hypothetical protein
MATEQWRQTEGVDNAFVLLGNALYAADPLAAVANRTNTLKAMWASETREEKVPWKRMKTIDGRMSMAFHLKARVRTQGDRGMPKP